MKELLQYDTVKMGTLYLDGQAQYVGSDKNVPRYKKNQKILIGDTDPDSASLWVRVPTMGILVADRVILVNVSAEELFAAGFDIGQRITIDGNQCICRLMRNQTINTAVLGWANTEWDACIRIIGPRSNELLDQKRKFWVNDARVLKGKKKCLVQNGEGRSKFYAHNGKYSGIGFRPVLVPVEQASPEGRLVSVENQEFIMGASASALEYSFRPYLWPVHNDSVTDTSVVDESFFAGVPDGTVFSAYTLMMNGEPVPQNRCADCVRDAQLSFTDQFYGKEYVIEWVIYGGRAVAKKEVLYNIRKNTLVTQGFLKGDSQ